MNAKAKNADRAKTPMSNKKYLGIWVPVLATVTVVTVVANVGLNVAGGWVASQLGSGTYTFTNAEKSAEWDTDYYTSDFASIDEVDEAAKALVEEIAASGIVLAKNEAGALPLAAASKVTMLGRAAADPVFGGSGSGSVDTNSAVTARGGLENAGLTVNDTVFDVDQRLRRGEPSRAHRDGQPRGVHVHDRRAAGGAYEAQAASFAEQPRRGDHLHRPPRR